MRPYQVNQFFAASQPVKQCDIVEGSRARGKQMRLRILDHLHAMLDRTQQPVRLGELAAAWSSGDLPTARAPELHRASPRRGPRIAAAVDHLLDLHEEFDLADSAAASFQVEAGAHLRSLGEMVADSRGYLPHFVDYAEVERAAPHERLDRVEEPLAERDVARGGTSADESRTLPR